MSKKIMCSNSFFAYKGTLDIHTLSKPIIGEIDRALARHDRLSDEELDFIINYDVKHRMDAELEGEE